MQPIVFASLDFILLIYTNIKVKLSVYLYMRTGIVSATSHSIFSFDCIPLFSFLPSFCYPNPTFVRKSKLKSLKLFLLIDES